MISTSDPTIAELLEGILQSMVSQVPMLLAYAGALICIIVRWRQAPRASMLALCGVLFALFLVVAMPVVYHLGFRWWNSGGNSTVETQHLILIISFVGSAAHAISFGFLFMAIYAGRRPPGSAAGY
jgi:hypothetical protein